MQAHGASPRGRRHCHEPLQPLPPPPLLPPPAWLPAWPVPRPAPAIPVLHHRLHQPHIVRLPPGREVGVQDGACQVAGTWQRGGGSGAAHGTQLLGGGAQQVQQALHRGLGRAWVWVWACARAWWVCRAAGRAALHARPCRAAPSGAEQCRRTPFQAGQCQAAFPGERGLWRGCFRGLKAPATHQACHDILGAHITQHLFSQLPPCTSNSRGRSTARTDW